MKKLCIKIFMYIISSLYGIITISLVPANVLEFKMPLIIKIQF